LPGPALPETGLTPDLARSTISIHPGHEDRARQTQPGISGLPGFLVFGSWQGLVRGLHSSKEDAKYRGSRWIAARVDRDHWLRVVLHVPESIHHAPAFLNTAMKHFPSSHPLDTTSFHDGIFDF